MIDKNGVLLQKTTFKGFDQNMMGLIFKDFLDLERGITVSSQSKLNWKNDLNGVEVPHKVFQYLECDNNKICKRCEISPNIICFECEAVKACTKFVWKR